MEHAPEVVRRECAGGVILRRRSAIVELLVVYTLQFSDPSLPRGGCWEGETARGCAEREIREETGYEVALSDAPAVVRSRLDSYPPVVEQTTHFFAGRPTGGGPEQRTASVITQVAWLPLRQARLELRRPDELAALGECEGRVSLEPYVLIDADACPRPCLHTAARLAGSKGWRLLTVASFHHRVDAGPETEHVVAGDEPGAADLVVANRILRGDIVVTQDWGLAALALGRGGAALSPSGRIYTRGNIGFLLEERHTKARLRRAGGRTRGPAPRHRADDRRFEAALSRLMEGTGTGSAGADP